MKIIINSIMMFSYYTQFPQNSQSVLIMNISFNARLLIEYCAVLYSV